MQSSSTLIKISGPIPKVKKIWIDQRFKKYFCTLERIQAKQGDGKQVVFFPNTVEGHNPSKQNCYINKNIPWKLAI